MLLADKDFFDFTEDKIKNEIINLIKELKKNMLNQKLKQVQQLLSEAEKNKDQKQIEELAKDFSILSEQLQIL